MSERYIFYISGPITGIPGGNKAAFDREAARLRALGHAVENPAEVDLPEGATWEDYMRADIPMLCRADAVSLLPGWERSRGARLEHHIARELGLSIILAAGVSPFERVA